LGIKSLMPASLDVWRTPPMFWNTCFNPQSVVEDNHQINQCKEQSAVRHLLFPFHFLGNNIPVMSERRSSVDREDTKSIWLAWLLKYYCKAFNTHCFYSSSNEKKKYVTGHKAWGHVKIRLFTKRSFNPLKTEENVDISNTSLLQPLAICKWIPFSLHAVLQWFILSLLSKERMKNEVLIWVNNDL